MKKNLILIMFFLVALSMYGCSTSKAEKEPVVIKDNTDTSMEDITTEPITELPNSNPSQNQAIKANSNVSTATEQKNSEDQFNENTITPTKEPNVTPEEPFKYAIDLEGMKETINCKIFHSTQGYDIFYDIDRFTITNEDGIDSFMVENLDPELYPYIYFNINRYDIPTEADLLKSSSIPWSIILHDSSGNGAGYLLKSSGQLVMDIKGNILGYVVTKDSAMILTPVKSKILNNYNSYHYIISDGNEWNSPVREYYYLIKDNYLYEIEVQYYAEAAEGYGARIDALLNTFTFQ